MVLSHVKAIGLDQHSTCNSEAGCCVMLPCAVSCMCTFVSALPIPRLHEAGKACRGV